MLAPRLLAILATFAYILAGFPSSTAMADCQGTAFVRVVWDGEESTTTYSLICNGSCDGQIDECSAGGDSDDWDDLPGSGGARVLICKCGDEPTGSNCCNVALIRPAAGQDPDGYVKNGGCASTGCSSGTCELGEPNEGETGTVTAGCVTGQPGEV